LPPLSTSIGAYNLADPTCQIRFGKTLLPLQFFLPAATLSCPNRFPAFLPTSVTRDGLSLLQQKAPPVIRDSFPKPPSTYTGSNHISISRRPCSLVFLFSIALDSENSPVLRIYFCCVDVVSDALESLFVTVGTSR